MRFRTMEQFTPDLLDDFLTRFGMFCDAIVRRVVLVYGPTRTVTIHLEAMDCHADYAWRNVEIVVEDVSEFRLIEYRSTCAVVAVIGVKRVWDNETVYLDFSAVSDITDSIDDVRQSDFYVAGRSICGQATEFDNQ